MSSGTINRPSTGMTSVARSTRFGDFPTTTNRVGEPDKVASAVTFNGAFGNGNTWQSAGGIWGGGAIGSGYTNGKRDTSRPRASENEVFDGRTGSGALAASSEVDAWVPRQTGPWNVDSTSPPSHSGTTSPVRHRGSNHSVSGINANDAQITPPYLMTSRPTFGTNSSYSTRGAPKSSLDPASGPFKYPLMTQHYHLHDENDKKGPRPDSSDNETAASRIYGSDHRGSHASALRDPYSSMSVEKSLPSSRHSDTTPHGINSASYFPGASTYTHGRNNSVQAQRSAVIGRNPSFPSLQSTRSLAEQVQDIESNLSSMPLGDKDSSNAYPSMPSIEQRNNFGLNYNGQAQNPESFLQRRESASARLSVSDRLTEPSKDYAQFRRQTHSRGQEAISALTEMYGDEKSPKHPGDNISSSLDFERSYGFRPLSNLDQHRVQFPGQNPAYFPHAMYNNPFQGQFHPYDFAPHQDYRAALGQYGFQMGIPAFTPGLVPRGPIRDHDVGRGVRSPLLDEFRSNTKSAKRYELKDIYNHVVEFSGDQHGSRFIQQKLETANSDEKEQIFREIQPNALQLMTDVFGNYVIQKLFEHGNQIQKRVLAEQMRNHVNDLSVQMYGCRVVQKALEHVLTDQQIELVKELEPDVLRCVKDQNGNHVIQKAIERVPTEHVRFILDAFKGQVHTLATHPYGCRVIQRMLEYCSEADQASVLTELFACASILITDQYGNYVTQHIIAHGKPEEKEKIINIVTAQLLTLSKHKFASNVVEKSIQFGTDVQRRAIVSQMTVLASDGSSPLQLLMKDQYGNYVVQKLLGQLKDAEREQLIEDIKPQLLALKRYNYGKQIAAIEKLIFTGNQPPSYDSTTIVPEAAPAKPTMPLDINSSAPTPHLTTEQNSPQSSSLPSTTASADGRANDTKTDVKEQATPELAIINV